MSRVVHFEIRAAEPQKVIDFYSSVLDWKFQKWSSSETEYWLVATGDDQTPGINGGLAPGSPVGAVVNTIGVSDLDETIDKVEEHGGRIVLPRVSRPGMGWYASFEDPVGNHFGLLQADAVDHERPNPEESGQQTLPGWHDEKPKPRSGRTTSPKATRKMPQTTKKSPVRANRSGTRSPRLRTKSSR
jgi:predicted enzyme related to lactoylglutathione lyase